MPQSSPMRGRKRLRAPPRWRGARGAARRFHPVCATAQSRETGTSQGSNEQVVDSVRVGCRPRPRVAKPSEQLRLGAKAPRRLSTFQEVKGAMDVDTITDPGQAAHKSWSISL